jgi:hypothetical protein
MVAERVDREDDREGRLRQARAHEELPAVDVVRQRSAVQAEDQQRPELDEADRADGEVGAGQRVDLERDRDVGDHLPEVEDPARPEQQPEVPRGAQRRGVQAQRAEAVTPGHESKASHPGRSR